MTDPIQGIGLSILIGVAATALMDAWLLLLTPLGLPMPDWRLVGRWVGQVLHGRFAHASMAQVPAARGEHALGWLTHYTVGIAYAVVLIAFMGTEWARHAGDAAVRHAARDGLRLCSIEDCDALQELPARRCEPRSVRAGAVPCGCGYRIVVMRPRITEARPCVGDVRREQVTDRAHRLRATA